jgi:hypothetical protein
MLPSRAPLPSDFDTIVDRLFGFDERPGGAPRPTSLSLDSLQAAWSLNPQTRSEAAQNLALSRHRYQDEGAAEHDTQSLLDPNKILLELGLASNATEEDVLSLRREFALRNHPDRVRPELRELATQRMMIANDLMDRYVTRLRKGGT